VLGSADVITFVPTREPDRARVFFEHTLGLKLVSDDPFALVFDANGVMLRVVDVSSVDDYVPAPFTILGWDVPDVHAVARELTRKGVELERFPGMAQDEAGIWKSPSGAQVAWFKDPDGNILSITET
jgi:catechol 2,3-dioxygenase-like lactoylglutathione lyase family enzyme